jgi:ribose transport system substrate-binding protein
MRTHVLDQIKKVRIIFIAASLALLAGCGSSPHSPTENYILVATNIKLPYWQAAATGLKQAASELQVKYEVVGPDTYDPKAQHEEFQRLLARPQKPTGILISASDPELMKGDIDAAIAQGIPVIAIDADAPSSKRLFFVGTDNYKAGNMAGKVAADRMKGKGNVVVFTMPGQANLADRLRGYQDAFASHPQIKIVQTVDIKGNPSVAFDAAKAIVTGGKVNADAFVCLEAIACPEVAEVLDRNDVKGKTVVAFDTEQDTLDRLKKGTISATIAQKPFTMAYIGLKMLDDLHHHMPPSLATNWAQDPSSPVPSFVDTGATLITQDNVNAFLQAAAPAPEKQ